MPIRRIFQQIRHLHEEVDILRIQWVSFPFTREDDDDWLDHPFSQSGRRSALFVFVCPPDTEEEGKSLHEPKAKESPH